MGILCARKGCESKKAYGLFCLDHRPVKPMVVRSGLCAANFCSSERDQGSMFCGKHKRAMDRECASPKAFDSRTQPFRAPLPDLKCKFVVDPKRKPISRDKLLVRWRADQRRYEATCRTTNVVGHGATPGDAIRDWQWWWAVPF